MIPVETRTGQGAKNRLFRVGRFLRPRVDLPPCRPPTTRAHLPDRVHGVGKDDRGAAAGGAPGLGVRRPGQGHRGRRRHDRRRDLRRGGGGRVPEAGDGGAARGGERGGKSSSRPAAARPAARRTSRRCWRRGGSSGSAFRPRRRCGARARRRAAAARRRGRSGRGSAQAARRRGGRSTSAPTRAWTRWPTSPREIVNELLRAVAGDRGLADGRTRRRSA